MDKLDWDNQHLHDLLCQLNENDFQKTVPNCKINGIINQDYIDADQYEIFWDEETRTRQQSISSSTTSLSLKIAVYTTPEGDKAGLITMHLSGSQW